MYADAEPFLDTAQAQEKKSKGRFTNDTVADHTRYVQQLNTLTNELSQARVAHSTYINQKHTSVLFFAGATVTRLSDAEWHRACEEVRKSAAVIGRVGEWRAHCEGGWAGDVPGDLVDLDQASVDDKPTRDSGSTGGRLQSVAEEVEISMPQPETSRNANGTESSGGTISSLHPSVPDVPSPAYTSVAPQGSRPLPNAPFMTSPHHSQTLPIPTRTNTVGTSSQAASSSTSLSLPSTAPAPYASPSMSDTPLAGTETPLSSIMSPRESDAFPFPDVRANQPINGSGIPRKTTPPPRSSPSPPRPINLTVNSAADATQVFVERGSPPQTREPEVPPVSILKKDSQDQNTVRAIARPGSSSGILAPRPTFAVPPPPPPLPAEQRPRPAGRSASIDSTTSNGSVVAAMREKYGESSGSSSRSVCVLVMIIARPCGRD